MSSASVSCLSGSLHVFANMPTEQDLRNEIEQAEVTNRPRQRQCNILTALTNHHKKGSLVLRLADPLDSNLDALALSRLPWVSSALQAVHHPCYVDFLVGAYDDYLQHREGDASMVPFLRPNVGHSPSSESLPTLVPFVFHQPISGAELEQKVKRIALRKQMSLFATDTMSPIGHHTALSALQSAVNSIRAAAFLLAGGDSNTQGPRVCYALNSMPGHHAMHMRYGGYCFANNAFLAAHTLASDFDGEKSRGSNNVLVLDVDFHAGVSDFFKNRPGDNIHTVSLHRDPAEEYPYTLGFGSDDAGDAGVATQQQQYQPPAVVANNENVALPAGTTFAQYAVHLHRVLQRQVRDWKPDYLVLAFGGDTWKLDPDPLPPSNRFQFELDDYSSMGNIIRQYFSGPILVTQEGGYHMEAIGEIVARLLSALVLPSPSTK